MDSAPEVSAMQEQCTQLNASLKVQKSATTFLAHPASSGTNVYVPNKQFFKDCTSYFGYIDGGYCSYIAANLVLQYWESRGMLTLPYAKNDIKIGALTGELYLIGENLGYDNSAEAWEIANVINKFGEKWGVPQVAAWGILDYDVKGEIDRGRPSMLVCKPNSPINCGEHTVVAYGYTPANYYIVHFGWNSNEDNDYTEVIVTGAAYHFNACYRMEE